MLHKFKISWNSFAAYIFIFKKFKNNTVIL
jgi:hypothetical protein